MNNKILSVIGNACTDIIADVDESFLNLYHIKKGLVIDLSLEELNEIKSHMPPHRILPGGAGANVAHVFHALGGQSHFFTKVGNDAEGKAFIDDMDRLGISISYPIPLHPDLCSPQVLSFNTPDGDRSFASHDGVALTFCLDDLDLKSLSATQALYLDGYVFCSQFAEEMFIEASRAIYQKGGVTILNFGDASLYEAHPESCRRVIQHCQSLICNRTEAIAMYGDHPLTELAKYLANDVAFGAITDGGNGAIVFQDNQQVFIPAADISHLSRIDSIGAGDHFSAGFLYGLLNGWTLENSGHLGSLCALDCLSHTGGRPLGSLKHLVTSLKS